MLGSLNMLLRFCLSLYFLYLPTKSIDLYVSSNSGSDSTGNGSSSNPFQTIQKAQSTIESFIVSNPDNTESISVYIANGDYYGPITFSTNDYSENFAINYIGGSPNAPANNGDVSIRGGKPLSFESSWTPVSSSNNKINQLSLSQGLTIWTNKLDSSYNEPIYELFETTSNNRLLLAATDIEQYHYMGMCDYFS